MNLKDLVEKCSHLIFPKLCLHCFERVSARELFCKSCSIYFELLNPIEHCPICFSWKEDKKCACMRLNNWSIQRGACLSSEGVVHHFIAMIEGGEMGFLTKTATSFLMIQFHRLGWKIPDLIVPCPEHFLKRIIKGGDPRNRIARQLSKTLKIPCLSIFSYIKGVDIKDKTLLFLGLSLREYETYQELIETLPIKKGYYLTLMN